MTVPLQPKGRGSVLQATGSSMPGVGSGAASMARAWANNPIAGELESWAQELIAERKVAKQRERISQATQLGAAYGNRFDEDNKVMPLDSLGYTFEGEEYSLGSPEQQAYQNAALNAYSKNLRSQYNLFAKEEAAKNPHDPAALLKVLRKHKENIWKNSLDEVKNELEPELRHITNTVYAGVLETAIKRSRDNVKAQLEQDLTDTLTEAENLIRQSADTPKELDGNITEDRLGVLKKRHEKTLKSLFDANLINFNEKQTKEKGFTDTIDLATHKQRVLETYRTQGLEDAVGLADQPFESRQISDADREKNRDAMYNYVSKDIVRASEKQASLRKTKLDVTQKTNEQQIENDELQGAVLSEPELTRAYNNGEISHEFYHKRVDPQGTLQKQMRADTAALVMRQVENTIEDPKISFDESKVGYRNAKRLYFDGHIDSKDYQKIEQKFLEKQNDLITRNVTAGLVSAESNFSISPKQYAGIVQNQIDKGNPDFVGKPGWITRVRKYREDYIKNREDIHDASVIKNRQPNHRPLTTRQNKKAEEGMPEDELRKDANASVNYTGKTGHIHKVTKNILSELITNPDPQSDGFKFAMTVFGRYLDSDVKNNYVRYLIDAFGKEKYAQMYSTVMDANNNAFNTEETLAAWRSQFNRQSNSSASRNVAAMPVQANDPSFAEEAGSKLKQLLPGLLSPLFAEEVDERLYAAVGEFETQTGLDISGISSNNDEIPAMPPDMINRLQQIYTVNAANGFNNDDAVWSMSFAELLERGEYTIDNVDGDLIWVTAQPLSEELPAQLPFTTTSDDHKRKIASELRELGYTLTDGSAIRYSDIRTTRMDKFQLYTQRSPLGRPYNTPHRVRPFSVEIKDGDRWKPIQNYQYVADAQELYNRFVLQSMQEVREGLSVLKEPINYFSSMLAKIGLGDERDVIADKSATYFEAFKSMDDVLALQDATNFVMRRFGQPEIDAKLDYNLYVGSGILPGDVAARIVIDSAKILTGGAVNLGSGLIDSISDAGGKTPQTTARFDLKSMKRANPGVLDIEAPANAETILPDGTRVSGDASVFDLKEPDPLDIKAPADAVTVLPDGTRVRGDASVFALKEEDASDIPVPPGATIVEPDGSETVTTQAETRFGQIREVFPSPILHTQGSKGPSVVKEATAIINNAFGGGQFLTEIANAESRAGEARNTFAPNRDDKGIWQVSKGALIETQVDHARLRKAKAQIKRDFGLDWNTLKHEDVTEPLIGALAARLYLMFIMQGKKIPKTLKGRAEMWKKLYNTAKGEGTVEHYLKANA